MLTLTVEQMRRVEAAADRAGVSYARLMENAGTMAYHYLEQRCKSAERRCLILAGAGNNGGDGFVVARHIFEAGGEPVVVLCCGLPSGELAVQNYHALLKLGVCVIDWAEEPGLARSCIQKAQLIVDAIFGTGFHGSLSESIREIVQWANASSALRIALDIPSGMNADTGETGLCIQADVTLSFAAYKPAHHNAGVQSLLGRVDVLDIGIPAGILFSSLRSATEISVELVKRKLPLRKEQSHKGSYGRLLNVAGSLRMCGAAMMSTLAALRMGVGLTTLAAPISVTQRLAGGLMEAMTLPLSETMDGSLSMDSESQLAEALRSATACLVGCGLSVTSETKPIVERIIKNAKCRLVLDADALNCICSDPSILRKAGQVPIITPHIGEMARLVGMTPKQVTEYAAFVARCFAREYNTVVVLKDHRTLVATPEGELFGNTTGNAGLAKGGSGDVLAGMIAALAAQGMPETDAAICGVYLHGLCADRLARHMSGYSMLARDVIAEIPYALKSLGR